MDDSFHEMIVKARLTANYRLKMAGLVLAGIVILILVILTCQSKIIMKECILLIRRSLNNYMYSNSQFTLDYITKF